MNLLYNKMYINSHISNCELVHLIYTNENSILLDENKNVINIDDDIFKAKYLSDITFSSNDYVLNTLLTLLPKKIHVHLIDNCVDEFIHTIGLIFENKVEVCTDCNICKIYKNSKNNKMNMKKISKKIKPTRTFVLLVSFYTYFIIYKFRQEK